MASKPRKYHRDKPKGQYRLFRMATSREERRKWEGGWVPLTGAPGETPQNQPGLNREQWAKGELKKLNRVPLEAVQGMVRRARKDGVSWDNMEAVTGTTQRQLRHYLNGRGISVDYDRAVKICTGLGFDPHRYGL